MFVIFMIMMNDIFYICFICNCIIDIFSSFFLFLFIFGSLYDVVSDFDVFSFSFFFLFFFSKKYGQTAQSIAEEGQKQEILDLLKDHVSVFFVCVCVIIFPIIKRKGFLPS